MEIEITLEERALILKALSEAYLNGQKAIYRFRRDKISKKTIDAYTTEINKYNEIFLKLQA
jgi:hypothetical protein